MAGWDVVVVGSGLGGLTAAALLAKQGRRVLVCESHGIPGGAAHSFHRQGFTFDSGPSFYCGLADPRSANPLRLLLALLEEPVAAVPYDPLGYYHLPEGTLPIYGSLDRYEAAIAQVNPQAAAEFAQLAQQLLQLYRPLQQIPTLALRADWQLLRTLLTRYPKVMVQLLPRLRDLGRSMGDFVDQSVRDPWLTRLLDLECFLLSGMTAHETVAPEMAAMFGERSHAAIDYPIGGSGALVEALVRGLRKQGGELRLSTHVEKILVEDNQVRGVRLRSGEIVQAPTVISNATVWDTYRHLLAPADLPSNYRQAQLATPAVASFMHLHLGIRADGLDDLAIHHVVVHSAERPVTEPGNTCMISIPSVLDPALAPAGHHTLHAYTLEAADGWNQDETYLAKKQQRAEPLYRALEKVIPDVRDRAVLTLIGTPLTHQRYLRRAQGTYGPALAAKQGRFPSCKTPIDGLYRVGDSTLPGIGVPAVVASGILCANHLVSWPASMSLLDEMGGVGDGVRAYRT
ncbi:MAG: NAD(P)/FAD-dependent oxidoreductase [Cyanobacteria bacterium P01_A01_bin.105]